MRFDTLTEVERRNLRFGQFGSFSVCDLSFPSVRELHEYLERDIPETEHILRKTARESAVTSGDAVPSNTEAGKTVRTGTAGRESAETADGFEKFMALSRSLEAVNRKSVQANVAEPAFVGNRPNVPAFIAGAPKNMYRTARPKEKKVVRVFLNLAYTGDTTEAQVRNRGILALNLVRVLEQNGYIVDFRAFEASMEQDVIYLCGVSMKKPGEKLNPGSCYYPLCGQLFLRRVVSRLRAVQPRRGEGERPSGKVFGESLSELLFLNRNWQIPLGSEYSGKQGARGNRTPEREIFLGTPQSLGIAGENIFRDADSFIRRLKLDEIITVPKYETEEE
ncbi:MAG: hypothetical protein K6B39_06435 [Lachnospiraceae bacterium]|nr:hypothetical protein [Lachnospiraceae bacterium]